MEPTSHQDTKSPDTKTPRHQDTKTHTHQRTTTSDLEGNQLERPVRVAAAKGRRHKVVVVLVISEVEPHGIVRKLIRCHTRVGIGATASG